jgi:hypothetical protein
MKKGFCFVVTICFVLSATAFGAEQTTGTTPESQQEIQAARQQIRQVEQSVRKAAIENRRGQAAARSAEKQEHDGINRAINQVAHGQSATATKVADGMAQVAAAIEADGKKTRGTIWLVGMTSTCLLMIGYVVFAWWIRKDQDATSDPRIGRRSGLTTVGPGSTSPSSHSDPPPWSSPSPSPASVPVTAQIEKNPRPADIRNFAEKHPEVASFFVEYSSYDGRMIKAVVTRRETNEGKEVLAVEFNGIAPCGVDKAYKVAMGLLANLAVPAS